MASNLYRRPSGIYVVRLVVPQQLRAGFGKGELHLSTGSRFLPVAKAVAAGLLAHWRKTFLSMQGMDIAQVALGSAELRADSLKDLPRAAEVSGLGEDLLLREAAQGRLVLWCRLSQVWGHTLQEDAAHEVGGRGAPAGPLASEYRCVSGSYLVDDPRQLAADLLAGDQPSRLTFKPSGASDFTFVADVPVTVSRSMVEVAGADVEAIRVDVKAGISAEQLAASAASRRASRSTGKAERPISSAIAAYVNDRRRTVAADHARRIEASCRLLVDLEGDRAIEEFDRDRLRELVERRLPTLPANPAKLKLQHGSNEPLDWPRLSAKQQRFHATQISGLFKWMATERWIDSDPGRGLPGLVGESAQPKRRAQDARDAFDAADLKTIFSAEWWRTGRGALTRTGTYRTFLPYYFWLPLMGLYTGARINELCQLALSDIRCTGAGTWFIVVDEDDESKKLKNQNSRRTIPLHPVLVDAGLISWRDRLQAMGYDRLFPELLHDPVKGYSKAAVKWFSGFLKGLGWVRDGRKTFHSFRHTLASHCLNDLGLPETIVNQLTGHARGHSTLIETYRKDVPPEALVQVVNQIQFDTPPISAFDLDAGMQALDHAMRRKRNA